MDSHAEKNMGWFIDNSHGYPPDWQQSTGTRDCLLEGLKGRGSLAQAPYPQSREVPMGAPPDWRQSTGPFLHRTGPWPKKGLRTMHYASAAIGAVM